MYCFIVLAKKMKTAICFLKKHPSVSGSFNYSVIYCTKMDI